MCLFFHVPCDSPAQKSHVARMQEVDRAGVHLWWARAAAQESSGCWVTTWTPVCERIRHPHTCMFVCAGGTSRYRLGVLAREGKGRVIFVGEKHEGVLHAVPQEESCRFGGCFCEEAGKRGVRAGRPRVSVSMLAERDYLRKSKQLFFFLRACLFYVGIKASDASSTKAIVLHISISQPRCRPFSRTAHSYLAQMQADRPLAPPVVHTPPARPHAPLWTKQWHGLPTERAQKYTHSTRKRQRLAANLTKQK